MFITGTCTEWFWLIPLLGLGLMIGLMFFMCGKGCVVVGALINMAIRGAWRITIHNQPNLTGNKAGS